MAHASRPLPRHPAAPWASAVRAAAPRWLLSLLATVGILGGSACEREMLDPVCSPVAEGQLVVSEVRGPQAGVDTWGQWIEIYNDSGDTVSLAGIRVRLTKLTGTGEQVITVRDHGLQVGPLGRVVLGRFPRAELPPHVDYGYAEEEDGDLPEDAIVELTVCNELVDQVIYRSLPATGSLSLDGSMIPSASANDVEANWCNDNVDAGGGPTDVGIPGTPGEPNRSCP